MTIDLDNLPDICTADNQLCSFFLLFDMDSTAAENMDGDKYYIPNSIEATIKQASHQSGPLIDFFNMRFFKWLFEYEAFNVDNTDKNSISIFFKISLIKELEELPKETSKKQVCKLIINHIKPFEQADCFQKFILLYLRGISRLSLVPSTKEQELESFESIYGLADKSKVKLCNTDTKSFIRISYHKQITFYTLFNGKPNKGRATAPVVVEPLSIDNSSLTFECSSNMSCFESIQLNGLELSSQACVGDENNYFYLEKCRINKNQGQITITNIKRDKEYTPAINNLLIQNTNEKPVDLTCRILHNTSLNFNNANVTLYCYECKFDTIKWQKCQFQQVPYFDENSQLQHDSDIDNYSVGNLENIGRELEYVWLAQFFNRSGAYIEAQKLHRFFLLTKKTNVSCLKCLVCIYDSINKCGTSIKCGLVWLGVIFLCMLFIFASNNAVYSGWTPLNEVLHQLVPFIHYHHKITLTDVSQLVVSILTIAGYVILFLTALTIRKYLRIRE